MNLSIENLKTWMHGRPMTDYQRALAVQEFDRLLIYINALETSVDYLLSNQPENKQIITTEEALDKMTLTCYGAGNELKVGDKIQSGFVINYANLKGISPSEYRSDEISLSLKMFVEHDGMLYELYKDISKEVKY